MINLKPIFVSLFKEEYRLQKELFGGNRFLLFPLVMFGLVLLAGFGLQTEAMSQLEIGILLTGLHAFVYLFGLQTGSIVFINRDQFSNLLGEVTSVLSIADITPTSKRSFIFLFILKDIVYYSGFILLPLALGLIPVLGMNTAVTQFFFFIGLFVFGISTTIFVVSLYYRYNTYFAVQGILILSLIPILGLIYTDSMLGLTIVSPFYTDTFSIIQYVFNIGLLLLVGLAGIALYIQPNERSTTTVSSDIDSRYTNTDKILSYTNIQNTRLLKKQLSDLRRSSGGFGVVGFSYGVVIGIAYVLSYMLEPITFNISYPLFYSLSLILGSFATYTWINQTDDYSEYKHLPITVKELLISKEVLYHTFTILPTVFVSIVLGILYGAYSEMLISIPVIITLSYYQYSIIMSFGGFSPNETLFDGIRFGALTMLIGLPLMPLLILSIFFPVQYLSQIAVGLLVYSVVLYVLSVYIKRVGYSYWTNNLIE